MPIVRILVVLALTIVIHHCQASSSRADFGDSRRVDRRSVAVDFRRAEIRREEAVRRNDFRRDDVDIRFDNKRQSRKERVDNNRNELYRDQRRKMTRNEIEYRRVAMPIESLNNFESNPISVKFGLSLAVAGLIMVQMIWWKSDEKAQ